MGKAITWVPDAEISRQPVPKDMLSGHEQALAEALHLIDLLHEKGLLQLSAASLEQGKGLMDILVRQMDQPGALGGLKNVIALVQGATAMDARGLSQLLQGLAEGTKLLGQGERVTVNGVFDLMRLMHDPDVSSALGWLFTILKGIGQRVTENSQSKS